MGMRKIATNLVIRKCIRTLLQAGYVLSVNDGENVTLKNSGNVKDIFAAMQTTDEDYLLVSSKGSDVHFGWVRFIYGNEPWEVINDFSTNLSAALAPVNAFCESLED